MVLIHIPHQDFLMTSFHQTMTPLTSLGFGETIGPPLYGHDHLLNYMFSRAPHLLWRLLNDDFGASFNHTPIFL